jgi:hypothetical protein
VGIVNTRICKFCDLKEIEDEFHFFFRCKNNHTLRNILYKDINGICLKFSEYDRAKKLQLILSSQKFSVFIINIEYIVIHFIFSFNFTVYINFTVFF